MSPAPTGSSHARLARPMPGAEVGTGLVVAYAFAPDADTSAVAAVKRVVEGARPVDVVSHSLDDLRGRDDSLTELAAGVVRRHARVGGRTSFGGWASVAAFCEAGEDVVQGWEAGPTGSDYTSVYSRAHFIASHFLAALLVGSRPHLRWRAEFSDPLSRRATGEERPGSVPHGRLADRLAEQLLTRGVRMPQGATTYRWAEVLAYCLADELIFTSQGQRDYCLGLIDDESVLELARPKARVDPHVTLQHSWYTHRAAPLQLEPNRTHVGYFGGFYASQDPTSLFLAVSLLAPEDRSRLRLHLFTGFAESLDETIRRYRVHDVVVMRDRLPYLDFLAATRQMDALLAIDAQPVPGEARSHVRLSKLSDYLGSETGIWGIVTPGSDLADQKLTWRTRLGHVTGMMQVLTSLARRQGRRS